MPEGPEIRRAADRVARAVVGKEAQVRFTQPALRRFGPLLSGEEVVGVEPWGKALLTRFGNGLVVYSHNQLYGRWYVVRAGETPRTGRTLRLVIENDDHRALLYSASEIDVLEADDLRAHPFLATLGPDVLDAGLRAEAVTERLGEPRFRGRQLGAVLLDQRFLAGIGNYLRAEMLHVAGIHPARRAADCRPEELRALGAAIVEIARRAYEKAGITNEPSRAKELKQRGIPRRRYRHFVFDRKGEGCWECGETVARGDVGGRRTYWCPGCQPEAGA
ncbi:MAG: endonuclease VIII [Myxococcota bacterium]|nr:endonuclease VIII [Myxococcota bacterium]